MAEKSSDYYCSFQVIGYYPDYWQIPIPNFRYDKLTRVIFFSIYPNADGSLNTSQISLARQANLIQAAHTQGVDVSICVGGWLLSDYFSPMAANAATRTTFINSLNQYCLDYGLDGIDLDWEPVSTTVDRNNYTLLIQELKPVLSAHNLTLSVAVSALGNEFNPAAIEYIDWLHIMAYDMGTPHSSYEDTLAAISHWEIFGFPKSKIILGVPFYGRDADWKYYAYKDIVSQYAPAPDVDDIAGINFNSINTIKAKTQYVVVNHYGGMMIWELTQDSEGQPSLLTAITDEVQFTLPPDFNCDKIIDVFDLNYLIAGWLWGGCASENTWCGRRDLDLSNRVNLPDVAIFSQSWVGMQ